VRIVVIGGLGNFGARICRRLAQEPGLDIIATSRRINKTGALGFSVTALDIEKPNLAAQLQALAPDLVIHCAGPFQGQDYRVALASLACPAHYLDLADGRDFVSGFVAAVEPAAQAARRFAITGASTLPALSSAIIDALRGSFATLRTIEITIAPGQRAPRGAATMAAVMGYAGRAFQWWQDGAWRTVHGWQELKRERFSFGARLAAACDVPDLVLLPVRYRGVQSVTFRAALEVSVQHLAMWTIAACRRAGVPIPLARWAGLFDRMATWLNWLGTDIGGMTVRVAGTDGDDHRQCRVWELVARGNHGPEIPCMAAVILSKKLHGGGIVPGAQVCMGLIALSEFEQEFARWDITTQLRESTF
jgi:NAD(P)-dependent dehydrogenase (short-subunit alcohol dehydrogenase family)